MRNHYISGNMLRSRLYVCPVCGNIIHGTGEAMVSCCGITLPPYGKKSLHFFYRLVFIQ